MAKSEEYQYQYHEISFESDVLNNIPQSQSIKDNLEMSAHSDRIEELRLKLLIEITKLVTSGAFTHHQMEVWRLTVDGWTQTEIGKELGCTQSAIHKAMHGNISYNYAGKGVDHRHGGIVLKIQKLSRFSKEITNLLEEIEREKQI
jgi:hypothetical protein